MNQLKCVLIGLIVLFGISSKALVKGKIINCYFGTWANYRPDDGKFVPSDIDPKLCTHLSYSFFGISDSGEFKVLDPWLDLDSGLGHISKTIDLKKINPNLKVLAVVGGWGEGSEKYSKMAADPKKRKLFISTTVDFINDNGFDGLDLDWEYPTDRGGIPEDRKNFVTLLEELKKALKSSNKELGIAVAASGAKAGTCYDIPEIVKHVDFINVMTYDFATHWDKIVGFNAPLYGQRENNVNSSIHFWLESGAPASKLVLGVPFYGQTYKLKNPKEFTLGSSTSGAGKEGPYTANEGTIGYNEICTSKDKWSYEWAKENSVPFLHKANQFISYDDVESIKLKVDLANDLNLGGVMIWSIETDDFRGKCGDKYPLLNAINQQIAK